MPLTEPKDAFANFNSLTTRWSPDNARALVYASSLAYKDTAAIKATAGDWGFNATVINSSSNVLQAVIFGGAQAVVLAFRGTRSTEISDWMADFELQQVPFTKYFSTSNVGAVHDGFAHLLASNWNDIVAEIMRFQNAGQSLWITGHSLGGALALNAAAAFTFAQRAPVNGVYTFGQPRVGDLSFCTQCDSHFGDFVYRFVNNEDIVTRVPPRIVPHLPLPEFYGHCGQLRYFDAVGCLHSDEHWWNAFLLNTAVGFQNMEALLSMPVADHAIEKYAACIEKYVADLKTHGQPLI